MELKIYTDGGSLCNPGPAASAFVVFYQNKILTSHAEKIGIQTNNVAEYMGLVLALEKTLSLLPSFPSATSVAVFSDSSLMVNQLKGVFRIKKKHLGEFVQRVRGLEKRIGLPVVYHYIPREENVLTDSLVKKALGR